jgi:hypothetical protein
MVKCIKYILCSVILSVIAVCAESDQRRLIMLFDDSARATKALQPIDASTIDLLAILHDKSTPLLVSTSVVARLFNQAAIFEKSSLCAGGSQMTAQISAAKRSFDEIVRFAQQQGANGLTASVKADIQKKLDRLNQSEHLDVLEGLLPCYAHEFKAEDWIVKQVGSDLLLLIPKQVFKVGDVVEKNAALTSFEYSSGLKVDHLPTVDLRKVVAEYTYPLAHPWTIADLIFNKANSKLFVTQDEYKKAGKTAPSWIFMMMGHGYQYSYEEYIGLFQKQTPNGLKKTLDALEKFMPIYHAFDATMKTFLESPTTATAKKIYESFDGSFTDELQKVADAIAWTGMVFQDSYLPYLVMRISKRLSIATIKQLSKQSMDELTSEWKAIKSLVEAGSIFMRDALKQGDYAGSKSANSYVQELIQGRFCGMFHSHFVQALNFFDNQVRTHLVLYVTCYGGGSKRDHVFNNLLGNKSLSYTVIAGALTDAPARGLSYQLFDASSNFKVDQNGKIVFVLPYPKDFKKAFDGLSQSDTATYVAAIDKIHPVLPVRKWVNNLPFIRPAKSTVFSLLSLDGTVQSIEKEVVTAKEQPQVYLFFKDKVDSLTIKDCMPALVPMMPSVTCNFKSVIADSLSMESFVSGCFSVESHKKMYTYTFDSLRIKAGSLGRFLGVSPAAVVELRNVSIAHNKPAQSGMVQDVIQFTDGRGKKYSGSHTLMLDYLFSNTSKLLSAVKLV